MVVYGFSSIPPGPKARNITGPRRALLVEDDILETFLPCFHPLRGYQSRKGGSLAFAPSVTHHIPIDVPCGQCTGCRLERSRQWAMRCVHEASLWENNCFVTLTYNDDHIPPYGTLVKRDLQLFMKRLRKKFGDNRIRFYACGEYGDKSDRPHYHVLLFNFDFMDKKFWKTTNDNNLYVSETLETIWGKGFCVIGDVDFESAAYVARYLMKKATKPSSKKIDVRKEQERRFADAYLRADPETGEAVWLEPEFTVMSRRPGIGKDWFDSWSGDVYPDDFVVIRGKRMKPPRYYDEILRVEDIEEYERLKADRRSAIWEHRENCTAKRLAVREEVTEARINLLKRDEI